MSLHRGPFCISSNLGQVQRGFTAIRDRTLSFCQCGFAPSCKKAEITIVRDLCIFYYLQKRNFQPGKYIILVIYEQRGNWFAVNNDKLVLLIILHFFPLMLDTTLQEPKNKFWTSQKIRCPHGHILAAFKIMQEYKS